MTLQSAKSTPIRKATPIRNARIKRDFKRLLAIIADAREPDYSEVEALATKYGLYYDENGEIRESNPKEVRP